MALLLPSAALANGRIVRYERKAASPYELALGTIPPDPTVGNLHLALVITELESNTPVTDARVTVVGEGPEPDSESFGPFDAEIDLFNPGYYDVNTRVNTVGQWGLTVHVGAQSGEASAEFVISVREANPLPGILTFASLLVFATLIGLAIRTVMKTRGNRTA